MDESTLSGFARKNWPSFVFREEEEDILSYRSRPPCANPDLVHELEFPFASIKRLLHHLLAQITTPGTINRPLPADTAGSRALSTLHRPEIADPLTGGIQVLCSSAESGWLRSPIAPFGCSLPRLYSHSSYTLSQPWTELADLGRKHTVRLLLPSMKFQALVTQFLSCLLLLSDTSRSSSTMGVPLCLDILPESSSLSQIHGF